MILLSVYYTSFNSNKLCRDDVYNSDLKPMFNIVVTGNTKQFLVGRR